MLTPAQTRKCWRLSIAAIAGLVITVLAMTAVIRAATAT